jgi:hypothetical protein
MGYSTGHSFLPCIDVLGPLRLAETTCVAELRESCGRSLPIGESKQSILRAHSQLGGVWS